MLFKLAYLISRGNRRWQVTLRRAMEINAQARNGKVVIAVPDSIAAEILSAVYVDGVISASQRWAQKAADVSLDDWRAAAIRRADRLAGPGDLS